MQGAYRYVSELSFPNCGGTLPVSEFRSSLLRRADTKQHTFSGCRRARSTIHDAGGIMVESKVHVEHGGAYRSVSELSFPSCGGTLPVRSHMYKSLRGRGEPQLLA